MAGRSVIEYKQSVSIKRQHDSDAGKDLSQPVMLTPQTRAQVKRFSPSSSFISTPRSSACQSEVPTSRIPKGSESNSLSVTFQVSNSSCKSPGTSRVTAEVRVTRSRSNTPKTRYGRNVTPSSKLKSSGKDEASHVLSVKTPNEKTGVEGRSLDTPKARNRKSPKCDETPKLPHSTVPPKHRILNYATQEVTGNSPQSFAVHCQESGNNHERSRDKFEYHQVDGKKQNHTCAFGVDSKQNNPPLTCVMEKSKISGESSTISHMGNTYTQPDSVITSSSTTTRRGHLDEFQKVVEGVRKRRSTLSRRRSLQSLGGRKSLTSVLPILSLEDQISNIEAGLPPAAKVRHLLDISLREAMRRLEVQGNTENCFDDMQFDLITNSERLGSIVAEKMDGLPLDVDKCESNKRMNSNSVSIDEVSSIKTKTKKLEQEYKCWKSLLKERKLACRSAEREFNEAKSGETKIEDDCAKTLTSAQKSILASRPDYSQYIEEIKTAYEKTFFFMREVNRTSNIVSNFLTACDAVADSSYLIVEEMTFGTMKPRHLKCSLKTLMKLGDKPV
ncbi:uncharacterized protein [Palaemon carinicauda]|uniref:uncharacterized protein n=1 Tax=Palaemon carinicauda TaxID=392227 RepID=UPI0035B5F855